MLIRVHSYSDGTIRLVNLDQAQYITPTRHKDVHGQANAIIAFSEETTFYVTETIEEIEAMCVAPRTASSNLALWAPYGVDAKTEALVKDIFNDLTDRKGVFEDIDDVAMDEIKFEIKKIITDSGAFGGAQ